MAPQKKSTRGASRLRAALAALYRRDGPLEATPFPSAPQADDAAGMAAARPPHAPAAADLGSSESDAPNSPCDVYAERGQGPYLCDTDRELYEQDEPLATRQVRSDMRIFFTTALAFVVLVVTIYFHVTG